MLKGQLKYVLKHFPLFIGLLKATFVDCFRLVTTHGYFKYLRISLILFRDLCFPFIFVELRLLGIKKLVFG